MASIISATWKGDQALARIDSGARAGNAKAAQYIKSHAVADTPVEFGVLAGGAAVEDHGSKGDAFADASIVYDTPYAVFVHEIVGRKHPVGKDHFLSGALENEGANGLALMAAGVRRALG